MDMSQAEKVRLATRALVVAGTAIAVGLAIFQGGVFTPTMRAFQFTFSGITAGLSYAAIKEGNLRLGFAALLIWYLVLIFLFEHREYNSWLLVLNLTYIVGIAGAAYLHGRLVETSLVRGIAQRIAAMGVLVALANGFIVVILASFSLRSALNHPMVVLEQSFRNLQLGTLLGLAIGIGIEIAEYVLRWQARQAMAESGSESVGESADELEGSVVVACPRCGEKLALNAAEVEARSYTCPLCGDDAKMS
jgi:predicted RNA-binding Zn-ribbon protein involved in translation (DUF1610 family)